MPMFLSFGQASGREQSLPYCERESETLAGCEMKMTQPQMNADKHRYDKTLYLFSIGVDRR
jgi:hypothetical protein